MQYFCDGCREPVSDELDKEILEEGVIILCKNCQITPFSIDLTDYHFLDGQYANELEAQVLAEREIKE
jgi:hypothetical protein